MDSKKIEIEQSMLGMKHLWLLKKIVVRFLVLLSNVYEFAKENSCDSKTTVDSAKNTVLSAFEPVYVKDLAERIIVFVDDKFDKYAPSLAKKLVAKFQSLIYKTKPLVKILLITTQTILIPLINVVVFLLQTTKYLIQNTTTNTTTTESTPLVDKAQTPLQKGLTTTQTLLQSSPLAATTQTLLQESLDTTKSLVTDAILQKGPDLANQAQDMTKSLVGGMPLVSNVAQSLVTNPTDLASQMVSTTNSLVNKNPILEAVNSAAQNSLDTTKSLVTNTIFQKGTDLANQTQETTKSLFGGIPLVGNVAESLVTNPTDLANQIVNTTNSLVNENPVFEAVNSTAQSSLDTTKSLNPNTILQKGPDLANQAQDMTQSLVGGIPLVGDVAESLVTNPTDLANQIVNTTNSLANENPVLEAVNSAAQSSLDTTKSLIPNTILQKGPDLANQAQDMTKSLVGGIPLVGDIAESLVTNPTDLANQVINKTNSSVNKNPLLEAVNSAAQNI